MSSRLFNSSLSAESCSLVKYAMNHGMSSCKNFRISATSYLVDVSSPSSTVSVFFMVMRVILSNRHRRNFLRVPAFILINVARAETGDKAVSMPLCLIFLSGASTLVINRYLSHTIILLIAVNPYSLYYGHSYVNKGTPADIICQALSSERQI